MSEFINEGQRNAVAASLAEMVHKYFQNPEHRQEFGEWYKEKYGKEYDWKGAELE